MKRIRIKRSSGNTKAYRPSEQIYNVMWEFHNYDDDPKPSVPHGHSLDGKLKLCIWNGRVYDVRTKKAVGQASKKDMRKLERSKKFRDFVYAEREWYRETHGYVPELSGEVATNRITRVYPYKDKTPVKYVVGIKICMK